MLKKIILVYPILIVFFFGCKQNSDITKGDANLELEPKLEKQSNTLFVVFEDDTSNNNEVYLKHQFNFYNMNDYEYIIKSGDTLQIDCKKNDIFYVARKTDLLDTLFVKSGDSLFLNIKNGSLIKEIKGKREHREKWSYNKILKNNKYKQQLDSLKTLIFKPTISFLIQSNNYKINLNQARINNEYFHDNPYEKIETVCQLYITVLNEYQNELSKLNHNDLDFYMDLFKNKMFDDLFFIYQQFKSQHIKDLFTSQIFSQEYIQHSLFSYRYIRTLLFDVYHHPDKRNISISELSNIYETTDSIFKENLIEKAKIICLREMAMSGNDVKKVSEYVDKYKNQFGNTAFSNSLEEKYNFSLISELSNSEVNLIDSDNVHSTLEEVLENNKGKIVYIDFWASWCAPCIEVMPDLKKLITYYESKDITFVLLSIDTNKLKWEKASKNLKFRKSISNYLVLNHNESNFAKELNLYSIPRYLIFDKKGGLLYKDAPSPKNKNIVKLLDRIIY